MPPKRTLYSEKETNNFEKSPYCLLGRLFPGSFIIIKGPRPKQALSLLAVAARYIGLISDPSPYLVCICGGHLEENRLDSGALSV